MSTPTSPQPAALRPFAPQHPWDRNFFAVILALAWVGVVRGFGGDMLAHIRLHKADYPLIVHIHALVFVLWLVLFTVQLLLVRTRRLATHKRLGMAMGYLALGMVILGPVTALTVQHLHRSDPDADPAFLSFQMVSMVAFTGLIFGGLALREVPSAHKRLVLLATLYITDAGFSRWLAPTVLHHLGPSLLGFWVAVNVGPNVLILAMGVYDWLTRRRLHWSYVVGGAFVLANQWLGAWLYLSPSWASLAKRIIAAWP